MTPGVKLSNRVNFGWINESYDLYKQDFTTWILATVLFVILYIALDWALSFALNVPSFVTIMQMMLDRSHMVSSSPSMGGVMGRTAVSLLLSGIFNVGFFTMGNKAVRHEQIALSDLVEHFDLLPNFLINSFLSGIPMLIYDVVYYGSIIKSGNIALMMSSGVIVSVIALLLTPLFWLVAPLIADGYSLGNAYKTAFTTVCKDWLRAFFFVFVFSIIFLVSCCPCGLGMLITVPMSFIAPSLAYRDMIGMPKAIHNVPLEDHGDSWPPKPQS